MDHLYKIKKMLGFVEKIPFYYQIPFPFLNIKKLNAFDDVFVMYKSKNNTMNILSDICPHQGASLSKGWINQRDNIHCPYHGFEFDGNGYFCGIPNPNLSKYKSKSKTLPSFSSYLFKNDLYLCPVNDTIPLVLPHYPPEHYDPNFRLIKDTQIIDKNYRIVTENVLDMLHISYIHSFGNSEYPLPLNIRYQQLSEYSGRTTFTYRPFNYTISNKIGNTTCVIVENEFHLPTTTITRVIAGDIVKTVMTRSLPIDENTTLMYWSVYRNFWHSSGNYLLNRLADIMLYLLMKTTLYEDINILKYVYPSGRNGTIKTKYDTTILKYRETFEKFIK